MCLDDGEVATVDRGDLIDADVVLIVGIDIGVERTRVNNDG